MPLGYRINVLEKLKAAGLSTYRIRKDKLLSEATLQQLRHGKMVSLASLEVLCKLLGCQPGDILCYNPDTTKVNTD